MASTSLGALAGQLMNEIPIVVGDRSDRQPVATTQHEQMLQRAREMFAQHPEQDRPREPAQQSDLHLVPARIRWITAHIVMRVRRIECSRIRVATTHDAYGSVDTGFPAARVIEESTVAGPEFIAQHVAHLVVAHAVPCRRALRGPGQVVDAEGGRLRLHQPAFLKPFPPAFQRWLMKSEPATYG